MLSSVNLPGGQQRMRTYEDQLQMRNFFQEHDLISVRCRCCCCCCFCFVVVAVVDVVVVVIVAVGVAVVFVVVVVVGGWGTGKKLIHRAGPGKTVPTVRDNILGTREQPFLST